LRIVFMGTPEFAVPSLLALIEAGHDLAAVVTQPDKPVGRKRVLTPPPVKLAALRHEIPVLQPPSARRKSFLAQIRELEPEAVLYAAYGKILPQAFLDIPPHGCLNVHASLLPKYRGAAPIQWAIMNGEARTGISIMKADAGLDTGPVLLRTEEPIFDDDTSETLTERLARLGANLLVEAARLVEAGEARYEAQDDSAATFAPLITGEVAALDWNQPAEALRNRIRGLNPKPGAVAVLRGKEIKIWSASVADESGEPGAILKTTSEGPVVAGSVGALLLTEAQPSGSRRMTGGEFARGHRLTAGERFEIKTPW
jgi:methionyl-tRNA formyltransferase